MRCVPLLAVALLAVACTASRSNEAKEILARMERGEVLAYRTLTRTDFRASSRPEEADPQEVQLGARTCLHLISGDAQIRIQEHGSADERTRFTATFLPFRIHALMDPECSWFDPAITGAKAEYVLQHEQLHFALSELSARRLNAAAARLIGVPFAGATAKEANQNARAAFDAIWNPEQRRLAQENKRLDRETSNGVHPKRQSRWRRQVEEALEAR